MCPSGTFNGNLGAISEQQCFPCEPGFTCKDNGSGIQVVACPLGYYCPEYDNGSQLDPIKCPIYTYNNAQKLFLKEMCTYCPAGYDCDEEGIAEYQLHSCPLGSYCLPNALNSAAAATLEYKSLHQCPLGMYGEKTRLTAENGCSVCPAGKY